MKEDIKRLYKIDKNLAIKVAKVLGFVIVSKRYTKEERKRIVRKMTEVDKLGRQFTKDNDFETKEYEEQQRGKKAVDLIRNLQKILPKGWSFNEAVIFWQSLKGKVFSQKIKQCNKKFSNIMCQKLGESMQWLGIEPKVMKANKNE